MFPCPLVSRVTSHNVVYLWTSTLTPYKLMNFTHIIGGPKRSKLSSVISYVTYSMSPFRYEMMCCKYVVWNSDGICFNRVCALKSKDSNSKYNRTLQFFLVKTLLWLTTTIYVFQTVIWQIQYWFKEKGGKMENLWIGSKYQ